MDPLIERENNLKILLAHIKDQVSVSKGQLTQSIQAIKVRLLALERLRWKRYTRPSIDTLCNFYQLEEDNAFIKVANLLFPADGNIYSK